MNRDLDAIIQDDTSEITLDSSTDVRSGSPSFNKKVSHHDDHHSKRKIRKPFHFRTLDPRGESPILSSTEAVPSDDAQEATYSRYKYYQRLRPGPPQGDTALLIPDHVVPSMFFYPYIPGTVLTGKQNSLITIFAVWNTMMGTSLLSMPWAIEQAGLVAGLSLILVMAAICFYTAFCILRVYGIYGEKEGLDDFPDLCYFLLGRFGQMVSVLFSALSLLGASAVYWVLMSNFLYHSVKYLYDVITPTSLSSAMTADDNSSAFNLFCPEPIGNITTLFKSANSSSVVSATSTFDTYWNLDLTVPIYLALLLLPLISFKSATFFTKFNALGTVSVFYIVAFVITKASQWGFHVEFSDESSPFFVPLIRSNFPALSGMLALALYLHNCVVSIMKNNRHQENNGRDLLIAYVLVAVTYLGIGAVFYLTFPLQKDCIEDNLLNNFSRSDTLTVIARVFLLFQMLTVYPLLSYILRTQLLYAFFNSTYPSFFHVLGLNLILITICVVFAIFLPEVGTITRFSGALCGLVYIFTLPSLLYIVSLRRQNQGRVPVWVYLVHGSIVICGILNLVAQFVIKY